MKTLTAIVTLLLFAVFLSWTLAEVTCTALAWQCYVDDPREWASASPIRLPISSIAEN